jgi:hypothetical protein
VHILHCFAHRFANDKVRVGDPVKKTGVHGTCPLAYLKDFDIILDMMPDMMHIEKGDCEFCVCMCSFIYLVVLIYL